VFGVPVVQLQRIVSRCRCEFFYAAYGESSIDPSTLDEVPPPPTDEGGPWERRERAMDAFTLMHHDLDVCTNSLQVWSSVLTPELLSGNAAGKLAFK
jgi:hypothetical protein